VEGGAKTYMLTPSEGSGYIYVGSECHVISPGSSLKRPYGVGRGRTYKRRNTKVYSVAHFLRGPRWHSG